MGRVSLCHRVHFLSRFVTVATIKPQFRIWPVFKKTTNRARIVSFLHACCPFCQWLSPFWCPLLRLPSISIDEPHPLAAVDKKLEPNKSFIFENLIESLLFYFKKMAAQGGEWTISVRPLMEQALKSAFVATVTCSLLATGVAGVTGSASNGGKTSIYNELWTPSKPQFLSLFPTLPRSFPLSGEKDDSLYSSFQRARQGIEQAHQKVLDAASKKCTKCTRGRSLHRSNHETVRPRVFDAVSNS